ncbi:hypothetical protein TNCV_3323051 [Trichonephila clavipes]|nr:hypothetical protein TNCV_3323051 [Trichonephila clavipes]
MVNFIKTQRTKWAGHIVRMDEDRTTKKVSIPNQLAHREMAGHILDGLWPRKRPSFENKELENTSRKKDSLGKAS